MPASRPDLNAEDGRTGGRWLILAIVVAAAPVATRAQAQNYPWCSNFADGAGTNCGFSTLAQCKDEISGSGGYCDRNNLYEPPRGAAPAVPRTHKSRAHKSS